MHIATSIRLDEYFRHRNLRRRERQSAGGRVCGRDRSGGKVCATRHAEVEMDAVKSRLLTELEDAEAADLDLEDGRDV